MSQIDLLLPLTVRPGFMGAPTFNTSVVQLRGGAEYRTSLWANPLRMYEVGFNSRTAETVIDELITFILLTKGSLYTFRMRDWSDYKADETILGAGDGTINYFRLYKDYDSYRRRIVYPSLDNMKVYLDSDLADPDSYFIDQDNGTVVFATPPASGVTVSWSGEFYVPVRFSDDSMDIIMSYSKYGHTGSISIKEVRTRENISTDVYDDIIEIITVYGRESLSDFFDVLDIHINEKWRLSW
jgi:uncharacterized protein (TIGR02217 family)